ncbi:MAG: M48 family metalloprotease [Oligoflexia bacterium]|nr:M48 family metalloprotease [Oligoflexia bacterium]
MKAASLILLLIFLSACGSGTGINFYSYQQEEAMGAKYAVQVSKEMRIMNDATLNAYVKSLGARMVAQGIDNAPFEYKFHVVDSKEINAFAIPGGYLYVNLGLLKEADNEAELVGVLGHEIGHVVHRHGTKRMSDATLLQLAAVGAAKATGNDNGQYVGLGVMLFGQAGILKYGRNAELEADRTGVDILYRTGYDSVGIVSFFQKLQKIENEKGVRRGGLATLLSTHPPTHDRIEQANNYRGQFNRQNNARLNSPEFLKIKAYVAGLK